MSSVDKASIDKVREEVDKVREEVVTLSRHLERLMEYLKHITPFLFGPIIYDFLPRKGYPGTIIEIHGDNFAITGNDNIVTVSGKSAVVIKSSPNTLKIITDLTTVTGPLHVRVGAHTATGPFSFVALRYPRSGSEEDGPPIFFTGRGTGEL
jgi:hypothetical protein